MTHDISNHHNTSEQIHNTNKSTKKCKRKYYYYYYPEWLLTHFTIVNVYLKCFRGYTAHRSWSYIALQDLIFTINHQQHSLDAGTNVWKKRRLVTQCAVSHVRLLTCRCIGGYEVKSCAERVLKRFEPITMFKFMFKLINDGERCVLMCLNHGCQPWNHTFV